MTQLFEIHSITTYDGITYLMDNQVERAVLQTPGNMGMPPVEYLTRKGYKQDGATEIGTNIDSRLFSINYHYTGGNRDTYWASRLLLLDMCRPNRNGPLVFTIRYGDDETERSLVARAYGPLFGEQDLGTWNEDGYTEILSFIAHDPFFYNPAETLLSSGQTSAQELSFDIAFDGEGIFFDDESYYAGIVVNYAGTIYSYPIIEVDGPFSQITIQHEELNLFIQVLASVEQGGTLIIDPKQSRVVTTSGINYFTKLTPGTNLAQFRIEPTPVVAGGVNTFTFYIVDAVAGQTSIRIRYNERWIGI